MKRIVLSLVIVIFTICVTCLVSGIFRKIQNRKEISEKISRLPAFSFATLTKESFNSSEIRSGPVLVVRFHPECEHCQYEISEIMKSDLPLSGIRILMVSGADKSSIKKLFSEYNLSDYQDLAVLVDTSYIFGEIFGRDIVPSNYIYNKELKLVKVMYGEVNTETIFRYLQNSD
jgi:hypothetical protein